MIDKYKNTYVMFRIGKASYKQKRRNITFLGLDDNYKMRKIVS